MIDAGDWVDGNETSGHQSMLAKNNRQLRHGSEAEREAGNLIAAALGRAPHFVAAALPLKVFPPLFNRYSGGEEFGSHVDNAVRQLKGTEFRIRSDLSCTLFLADPDSYEGGELVIEDLYGEQRVKLAAGDMVLYPASSLHHVTPVTRGERVASFFWLQSMVRDHVQREQLYRLDCSVQTLTAERGGEDAVVRDLTNLYHNLLRLWADT
ncbi:Fe2+-dependent dioxygenase [Novosphingobium sp. HK4-1]|uniref:Fe2+-dependent dioxygenase n=1 Tax=Novosphingobium mangrovi (ex Huang et al. 2023) TaxID=2976432 RepID=A0ABT2I0W5_9SPHN|nr:Fe2+-dependent dioxygenase [Novosphingobium mangrovi (ex Huang et al. 2023)]MCT2398441.1 Fe2+-dependent dioxygenase [Novosphingobium mangrovi (ex Huang et al. 2023)]